MDGQFACVLHEDVFAACGFSAGDSISAEQANELLRQSQERFAREMALRLLSRRMYARRELFGKLAEPYGESAAGLAADRMEELGLINDRDYARRFAADAVNLKNQGSLRIARALAEKGISRELIEETLLNQSSDPQPAIAAIVLRKYSRHLAEENGQGKIMQALARLGWRYDDIREVLRNLQQDEEYYSLQEL